MLVKNIAELEEYVGKEIGLSSWIKVSQERINSFAEATEDRQWIHVDVEKAKTDSDFGSTIAHGMLTISLIPPAVLEILKVPDAKMMINYGFNQVRFPSPVVSGSSVRTRVFIKEYKSYRSRGTMLTMTCEMENDSAKKPACTAEFMLFLVP